MEKFGDLGIALYVEVFRIDPKTKKVVERVFGGNDPFIAAMIDTIYGSFANVSVNILNTSNVSQAFGPAIYFGYDPVGGGTLGYGGYGSTDRGIVVGISATAVALSDYKLWSLVAHGIGSGQLAYYQGSAEYISTITDKRIRLYQRQIANLSGAPITAYEMGLILMGNTGQNFCLARNVIGGGLVLQNQGYYLFQYKFEVS